MFRKRSSITMFCVSRSLLSAIIQSPTEEIQWAFCQRNQGDANVKVSRKRCTIPAALDGHGYSEREKLCRAEMDTNTLHDASTVKRTGRRRTFNRTWFRWVGLSQLLSTCHWPFPPLQITLLPLTRATLRARPFGSDDNLAFQSPLALSVLLHAC